MAKIQQEPKNLSLMIFEPAPFDYLLMAEKKGVQATKEFVFCPGDLMVMVYWSISWGLYQLACCGLLTKT